MSFWRWWTSPRGEYERENFARLAEKRGDHEQAALYRACLARHEWHALGYEGERGNYRKVSKGVSLYEATNGAYGAKQDFAPVKNLKRDLRALKDEYSNAYSKNRKQIIREEIKAIQDEIFEQEMADAGKRAAE